mmetsp:Transcript_33251/g.97999  ORF Transcript_33251/g.97999 Transcript_33251/m.97999 type:complete len:265 (+) Transcript_33251:227-1021(+)
MASERMAPYTAVRGTKRASPEAHAAATSLASRHSTPATSPWPPWSRARAAASKPAEQRTRKISWYSRQRKRPCCAVAPSAEAGSVQTQAASRSASGSETPISSCSSRTAVSTTPSAPVMWPAHDTSSRLGWVSLKAERRCSSSRPAASISHTCTERCQSPSRCTSPRALSTPRGIGSLPRCSGARLAGGAYSANSSHKSCPRGGAAAVATARRARKAVAAEAAAERAAAARVAVGLMAPPRSLRMRLRPVTEERAASSPLARST